MVDYGIRGMHLAYDLLDHDGPLVIVDAVPGPGEPGTIRVLEVGPEDLGTGQFDAHGMNPVAVLANLEVLGGHPAADVRRRLCPRRASRRGWGSAHPSPQPSTQGVAAVRRLLADLRVEV